MRLAFRPPSSLRAKVSVPPCMAIAHPVAALVVASVLLVLCLLLVYKGYGLWRKMVSSGS